ncbi:MAG: CoA-binding protein [Sphingobacteriales bacterium UTBCD1]|jgi:predicted CoA-binding protein|nr:MAG: CoA-binding protein [Sphingobacteriales bacterium UTBCD1]
MPEKKKTLVLGASDNPSRYSNIAIHRLREKDHPVVAIGRSKTLVSDVPVSDSKISISDIDTVTLYLNPSHQGQYYDYILSLKPRRIIFNPGAENPELYDLAKKEGIDPVNACTLVMLSTNQY